MQQFSQDLRLALRSFKKSPLFTAVAVLTLALGIGASTAVFAVVDGAILRPFPYKDMARIALLNERSSRDQPMSVAYLNFLDWRVQNDVFDEIGLYRFGSMTLTDGASADRLNTAIMTASVYDTIGIEPLQGRRFGPADDQPGDRTVLLSERVWRSRFAARPDLVGTTIQLNGENYTVIGLMPAQMRFPSRTTDAWLPFGSILPSLPMGRGAHPNLNGVGRIKAGVTFDQARASMNTIAKRLGDAYPNSNKGSTIDVVSYYESVVRNVRPALFTSLAAVGFVLLIACANLANLLLARGEGRRQEMALRTALGAGRRRLVQHLMTESFVLAAMGALAGVALAFWMVSAFTASRPTTIPRIDLIRVDWRALSFAAALTMLTTFLVGLLPAFRSSRTDLQGMLKDGHRSFAGRSRLRSALVISEIALALMLLVGAGLLMKSFVKLMSQDLGYSANGVLTTRIGLPEVRYPNLDAWTNFHDSLLARFNGAAGVEAIGISSALPLAGGGAESSLVKEGDLPPPAGPLVMASFQAIGGDYFKALGTELKAGRAFEARDRDGATPVVIIDEAGARRLFNGENPIGRRIAFERRGESPTAVVPIWREVVGVVPHITHYGLTGEPDYPQLFVPFTQMPIYMRDRRPVMALVARVSGDVDTATAELRRIVAGLDPGIPLFNVRLLSGFVNDANETQRLGGILFGAVSALALLLAVLGIYGVLSYTVSQRTREIGVRVALGAGRNNILSLVARQAGLLVGIGLVLGTGGAFLFTRFIKTLLVNVSPNDPVVFVGVAALLGITAGIAALLPARRAAAIDPVRALKQ